MAASPGAAWPRRLSAGAAWRRLSLGALLALGPSASAQTAAQEASLVCELASPTRANESGRPDVVLSFPVHVRGASALRLHFAEVLLAAAAAPGTGAVLRLTAHADGAIQELDARALGEWQQASAYFNGDTVQVEVYAWPSTGPNRVRLARVDVAWQYPPLFSQCGKADDRAPSADPRSARVLPIGCSSWIIDDCNHCLLTAGHCLPQAALVEFNVPLSSATGAIVHPSPDHQYAVDPLSVQGFNGTLGDDWGYFGVHPNPNTGLTPAEAQGNWYTLPAVPPAFSSDAPLRITGFGADTTPPQANQTQQSAVGPWKDLLGNAVFYAVDTTGGSSGSIVQHLASGAPLAIHTDAGCNGGPGNSGTALTHGGLQAALAQPSGVCAGSCTGSVEIYCAAKLDSLGCLPAIAAAGSPSVSAGSGALVLEALGVRNQKPGLCFYGFAAAAAPFFGGTLCAAAPLRRTALQSSLGSPNGDDCSGRLVFDLGAWIEQGHDGLLVPGVTVHAQFQYRDPSTGTPLDVGLSNAVALELVP